MGKHKSAYSTILVLIFINCTSDILIHAIAFQPQMQISGLRTFTFICISTPPLTQPPNPLRLIFLNYSDDLRPLYLDICRVIELLDRLQRSGELPPPKLQALQRVLQSKFCAAIREVR